MVYYKPTYYKTTISFLKNFCHVPGITGNVKSYLKEKKENLKENLMVMRAEMVVTRHKYVRRVDCPERKYISTLWYGIQSLA